MTGSDEMQKKMLRAWGTERGLCSVNSTMAPGLKYIPLSAQAEGWTL